MLRKMVLCCVCCLFSTVFGAEIKVWGNMAPVWKKIAGDDFTVTAVTGERPPLAEMVKSPIIVFSAVGSKLRFTEGEVKILEEYCHGGGILLIDGATICLFAGSNIYDLSNGKNIMGADKYVYGDFQPNVGKTALSREIFGNGAVELEKYSFGRGPALGGLESMKVLQGSDKVALFGVNRCGKGAFVYFARVASVNNAVINKLILNLLGKLTDEKFRETYFPQAVSNQAALSGGKRVHLAVGGGKTPIAVQFLTEKLAAVTGCKNFSAIGNHPEQITILVGQLPEVEKLGLDFAGLPKFGYFMLRTDDNRIILAGKNAQADRYAVNDFLKRFAGYRKYAASPLTEIIPKREYLELPERFNFRETPSIASYVTPWPLNGDFGRNSRLTAKSTHSFGKLISPDKYADKHPEWYSEINGKRVTFAKGKRTVWQPCMNNPELPRLVLEYADSFFKDNPDSLTLPLGVNDGGGDCQCGFCRSEKEKYGNQYVRFYNDAAKALKNRYPDKLLGFIAYGRAIHAPKNIVMEPNILVEICSSGLSAYDEYPKWQKIGIKHFGLYDYFYGFGGGYVVPRYYPRLLAAKWRATLKTYALTSMWLEYYPRTQIFEVPRQYVLDELAWNMEADVNALLEDYFRNMYGEAAKPVGEFFNHLEEIYGRSTLTNTIADWKQPLQMAPYVMKDLEYLDAKLAEACKLVKGDCALRLALLKKAWEFSRLYIEIYICGTNIEQGREVLKNVMRGYELVNETVKFTMTPDEEANIFVGKSTLAEFRKQTTLWPLPRLEKYTDRAFDAITADMLKTKSKLEVSSYWRSLADKSSLQNFKRTALTQEWKLNNPAVNLVPNPGFEVDIMVTENKDMDKPGDWQEFKNIKGWSTWTFPSSTARFYHDRNEKRNGQFSGAIGENQIGCSLICYVKLEPNCRYQLTYHVKRNDENDGNYGKLSVRMQGKGTWLDHGAAIVSPYSASCVGNWTQESITFSAPSDPATALLLFGAPRQGPDSRVWFDDISLVKIYEPVKKKVNITMPIINDPQIIEAVKTAQPILEKLLTGNIGLQLDPDGLPGKFQCTYQDDTLMIRGNAEGLRCGLYRILHKLGVRWFNPAEEIIVPEKPEITDLKQLDRFGETPSFSYRGLHICAGEHHFEERVGRWMSFNCMNRKLTHLPQDDIVGGRLRELGLFPDTTVHAYSLLISDQKYFDSNPEFFALVGGKRIRQGQGGQLCVSSDAMRETFANELLEIMRRKPHIGVYGFCPNDGYGWCECENCRRLDSVEDRKNGKVNARVAFFVEDICRRIAAKAPGKMLGHYSYSNFADFADYLKSIPENLIVSFTELRCFRHAMNDSICEVNRPMWERMKKLQGKIDHIYIYEYYQYMWDGLPAPIWRTVTADFNAWKARNITGFMTEVSGAMSPAWQTFWQACYTAAMMLWQLEPNPDGLITDWCSKRYGQAATVMNQYFKLMENSLYESPQCFRKTPADLARILPSAIQAECRNLLDEALKLESGNQFLLMENDLFNSWCDNLSERAKYQSDPLVKGYPMTEFNGEFKPHNLHLVARSTQLPNLDNNTAVMVFNASDELGFRLRMYEKNMDKLKLPKKKSQVYGGDNIEIFVADGQDPAICYHFLIAPDGRHVASSCRGSNWNWSWKHDADITVRRHAAYWEIDFRMPKSDVNAGADFKYTIIRNRYAGEPWVIYGVPNGGAFFKTENYLIAK